MPEKQTITLEWGDPIPEKKNYKEAEEIARSLRHEGWRLPASVEFDVRPQGKSERLQFGRRLLRVLDQRSRHRWGAIRRVHGRVFQRGCCATKLGIDSPSPHPSRTFASRNSLVTVIEATKRVAFFI
jgi:hypothetical protein